MYYNIINIKDKDRDKEIKIRKDIMKNVDIIMYSRY